MKQFIIEILTNPDGTYSAKRISGFISLFVTISFGFLKSNEPMIIMAGLTTAFFGLSTIDYKSFIQSNQVPQQTQDSNRAN